MPSSCQLDGSPGQNWNSSHTRVRQRPQRWVRQGKRSGRDGLLGPDRYPLLLRTRRDVPARRPLVLFGPGADLPHRRFLVAGTAAGIVSTSGAALVAPEPPNGTIFEQLHAHGITWRNYYDDLPAAMGVVPSVLAKYPHSVAKIDQFVADAAVGKLPSVSYVDPNFSHQSEEDPQDIRVGEQFAAKIINAVMHGPAWAKTVLVGTYDEHGGYYDHVPPPRAIKPDNIPPDITVPADLPAPTTGTDFASPR